MGRPFRTLPASSPRHIGPKGHAMPLAASKRQRSALFAAFTGLSFAPIAGIAMHRLADWSLFTGGMADYDTGAKFAARVLQVCTLILIAALDRKVTYSERAIRNAVILAAAGAAATTALFLMVPDPTLRLACAGLRGVFQTMMMVGWGYYLCSVDTRQSAFALTGAFAFSGVISWLCSFFPAIVIKALAIVATPLGALCLLYELSRSGAPAADEPLTRAALSRLPVMLLLLLGVCTLIGVFVHALVPTNKIQLGNEYQWLTTGVYLLIFAAFCLWIVPLGRPDPERLLPIFPVVILGGLVCYTSFIGQWPILAMDVLTATQNCTIVFCWLATAIVVHQRCLPRIFSFCVANVVFAEPITLSIAMRGILNPTGHVVGSLSAIAVTLVLALVLVVLTAALLYGEALKTAHKASDADSLPAPTPPADPLIAAIATMADDYALTMREQEVALHLARGRTFPETAETLGVSLDTVRTHVKCLYRKTGVHKKGRLIELIDERRGDSVD